MPLLLPADDSFKFSVINQTVFDLLKSKSRIRYISGYVFTTKAGIKIIARNLLRAYYEARKKAGLEDVRFHNLRHTFATRLVQAGVDFHSSQAIRS